MFKKIITLCVIASILTPLTWSNDSENSLLREEVKLLKQKLAELERRLTAQEEQAVETDRIVSTLPADIKKEIDLNPLEKKDRMAFLEGFGAIKDNYDFVSISGNIDVLGYYSDHNTVRGGAVGAASTAREDTSDIIIDQVRLNFDIDVSENVKAFIGLQFEDYQAATQAPIAGGGGAADTDTAGDTLNIDEAYITLGADSGIYAILGKQYMPFGNINESGNFINDTLTRQMYETRDTGAVLGLKNDNMDFSVFAFNGQLEEERSSGAAGSGDNKIDTWGASLSFGTDGEDQNMKFGLSYINNILQAQNTAAAGLDTASATRFPGGTYADDDNGAVNLYTVLSMGPIWLSAEYVTAINDLELDTTDGNGLTRELGVNGDTDVQPSAYTFELGLTCPVAEKEYTVAVKYEANHDFDDFLTPLAGAAGADGGIKDIWGVGVSTNIYENATLTLNYENWTYTDTIPSAVGVGGGGHANVFLAEVSIGF